MSDTLRFGRLHSGETARLEAGFCNRGREPLVVVRSESSCGCTSLEYDAQPIMPGGERPLRLYVEADVQ